MAPCIPLDDRPTLAEIERHLEVALISLKFIRDKIADPDSVPEMRSAMRTMRGIAVDAKLMRAIWRWLVERGKAR